MKVALLYLFLLTNTVCFSQTLNFDILYKGYDIGNLVTKVTKKGNTTSLVVTSKVSVKVVISIKVDYTLKIKYVDNELYSSSVVTYLNGNIRSSLTVTKKDGYYLVNEDGETRKFYGKITCSEGILCIKEPKNLKTVFSEFDAINKPIIKTADGKYKLTNPKNNNFTDMIYKNGVLQKSTVHYTLATFVIQRR